MLAVQMLEGRDESDPRAHHLASLTSLMSFRPLGDSVSKEVGHVSEAVLWPPYPHTSSTHKHTHKSIFKKLCLNSSLKELYLGVSVGGADISC